MARTNKANKQAALAAACGKVAVAIPFGAPLGVCRYFALKARCIPPASPVVLICPDAGTGLKKTGNVLYYNNLSLFFRGGSHDF